MHIVSEEEFKGALDYTLETELIVLSAANPKGRKRLVFAVGLRIEKKYVVRHRLKNEKTEFSEYFASPDSALNYYNSLAI